MAGVMNRKNRVLLIGPFPPPIGGDTVLTEDLMKSGQWNEHGIEIVAVDTSHRGGVRLPETKLRLSDIIRAFEILGKVLIRLPRSRAVLLWANRRFLCTLGTGIIYLCNLFGRPVLAKAFGGSLGKRIKGMSRRRRRYVVGMLKRCRFLLPETADLTRELVEDLGIPEVQVGMLPNFLPDRFFRENAGGGGGSFSGRCVFLGQIKREKGVFTIIRALSGHPGYSCDFFGPVVERDRERFQEEISGHSNLVYRGSVSPAQVPERLREYDALLLPTRHSGEGYPAVILQAFACGAAVIASRWLSIPDLTGENLRGILVPPEDPDALISVLDRLGSDKRFRKEITDNARHFAEGYSERRVIGGLLISEYLSRC